MTYPAILLIVGLWLPVFGQGYPPRSIEESGRLSVVISGNNRNIFSMTWSPKEIKAIPEPVLSALISKSAEIELIGRDRMKVALHEPNDGPAAFRESLVVGVADGKLYSTVIEAMVR
jgi:hypothetical protein